ncbi:MAG: RT0821/Lpp0805 family surface protein [Pseudomonadota bacterium]
MKGIALASVMGLSLTACAEGQWNKETAGTLLGAAFGGWVGSKIDHKGSGGAVAIAAGTAAGALIGNSIGRSMDKADRAYMEHTRMQALEAAPSGTTSEWYNPDSGNRGTITPQPAYQTAQGQYCREYQQTVTIGGKAETGYGTACRQPDGSWKIVN